MDFLRTQFDLQRPRVFLWTPILFAIGIGIYFALPHEPDMRFIYGSLTLLSALAVYTFRRFYSEAYRLTLIAALIILAGLAAAQIRTTLVHTPLLGEELGPVTLTAIVLEVESLEGEDDKRLLLGDLAIEDLDPEQTPRNVRLRLRKDPGVLVGQRIEVLAELMPLSSPAIPGGFDFQRHFYFQSIGAVGFIYKFIRVVEEPAQGEWFSIQPLRQRILQKIEGALQPPQAGIVSALVINEVSSIAEPDHEAMRVSGLAHMLSISGLHVTLVAGGVFFAVRLFLALSGLAVQLPIKKYAAVAGFAAAFFYMLLAGANVPVQRSVLMAGVVFLAIIFDRFPFSLRLVAFSALAVLAFSPDALISPSFQMSFAAVSMLIWFYEENNSWLGAWAREGGWIRKTLLYIGGIAMTSLIASLATAPFGVYHFQTFGLYSIPANLMGVPVLSFLVMPAGVVALVAMPFGLEYWPLQIMGWGSGFILEVAHWASSLPVASVKLTIVPFASLMGVVVGGLWLILVAGWLRALALVPLCAGLLFWAQARPPDILVAAEGELTGLVLEDGLLALDSKRREKFTAEVWESALGMEKGSAIDWKAAGLPCDELGCRYEREGHKIAFSERPEAQDEDCAWADVMIAAYKLEGPCKAAVQVDRPAMYRAGSHAVWLEGKRPRLESAGQYRGHRPWIEDYQSAARSNNQP